MTDSNATSKKKRQPSGAAVAGAHPRPRLFPRQVVFMLDDETADYIEEAARAGRMSKSEVGRILLAAGIEAAEALDAAQAAAKL